jgi:FixJ family two-component response regulator
MPEMSGIELQSRLILDGNLMPVIFVTAFPEEVLRDRVLKRGALAYLTKPMQEQNLIACLDHALKHPNSDRMA